MDNTDNEKIRSRKRTIDGYRNEIKLKLNIQPCIQKNYLQEPEQKNTKSRARRKSSTIIETEEIFKMKYEILEKLGQGSSATVYKCRHLASNQIYALKVAHCETQQIHQIKQIFHALFGLDHPSIIKYKAVYACIRTNKVYLVMEDFRCPDLEDYHLENEIEIRSVAQKLLSAVEYLHENGICHRDIKPGNILYDPIKKDIKLIDFNVSKITKLYKIKKEMMTPTGTPHYRAPQTFSGSIYSEKVDEWSVGATLYTLVTKSNPFIFQNNQQRYKCYSKYEEHVSENLFKEPIWQNYTSQMIKFIEKLLSTSDKRIPACEALKDIWFVMNIDPKRKLTKKTLKRLSKKMTLTVNSLHDLDEPEDERSFLIDSFPHEPELKRKNLSYKSTDENQKELFFGMTKKMIKNELIHPSTGKTFQSDTESLHYDSDDDTQIVKSFRKIRFSDQDSPLKHFSQDLIIEDDLNSSQKSGRKLSS